jgi:hypothetical protein
VLDIIAAGAGTGEHEAPGVCAVQPDVDVGATQDRRDAHLVSTGEEHPRGALERVDGGSRVGGVSRAELEEIDVSDVQAAEDLEAVLADLRR